MPSPSAEMAASGPERQILVKLSLAPTTKTTVWTARLENASPFPIRLLTDERLFWFDVAPTNGTKPAECRLPADLRPSPSAPLPARTLEPGDFVSYTLDPRFYCFGEHDPLSASARLTVHYGWPEPRWKSREPETNVGFVASAAQAGDVVRLRGVTGDTLLFEPSPAPASPPRSKDDAHALVLEMVRGSDARNERSVKVTVRLRNRGVAPVEVYVRRALLTFEIQGPNGRESCESDGEFRHPARLGFRQLAPGRSVTLTSRLVELCPRGTFADRGIYRVDAVFETDATGQAVGLDAFTGRLRADRPVVIRVRHALHLIPNHWVAQSGATPATPLPLPAPAEPPRATPPPPRARPIPRG